MRVLSPPSSVPGPPVASLQSIVTLLSLLACCVLLARLPAPGTSGPGHVIGPSGNGSGSGLAGRGGAQHTGGPALTLVATFPGSCLQGELTGQLLPFFRVYAPQLSLSSLETSRTSRLEGTREVTLSKPLKLKKNRTPGIVLDSPSRCFPHQARRCWRAGGHVFIGFTSLEPNMVPWIRTLWKHGQSRACDLRRVCSQERPGRV